MPYQGENDVGCDGTSEVANEDDQTAEGTVGVEVPSTQDDDSFERWFQYSCNGIAGCRLTLDNTDCGDYQSGQCRYCVLAAVVSVSHQPMFC